MEKKKIQAESFINLQKKQYLSNSFHTFVMEILHILSYVVRRTELPSSNWAMALRLGFLSSHDGMVRLLFTRVP